MPVAVVEIAGPDPDGDLLARPAGWPDGAPPPVIRLVTARGDLAVGDRALARLRRLDDGAYEARPMRRLTAESNEFLGIVRVDDGRASVQSTNRRRRGEFAVDGGDAGEATAGELVRARASPGRRGGRPRARVVERLGSPGALSAIAVAEHRLPSAFPPDALTAARCKGEAPGAGRADLRDLPLVTIDDADARDFDDAVWAEPDDSVPGGWHVVVAVADVAWYVRPDDPLDRAAFERGNSVYFSDRVLPMLPEALSEGWCSLKPGEDRPCIAVHLWIDRDGGARRHAFVRGLMRSAARLTYDRVQRAADGDESAVGPGLAQSVVAPLYGAFEALRRDGAKRAPLELDLPERRAVADGEAVPRLELRQPLESHRLIEAFMIAANVAAAGELEKRRRACLYRVHDRPAADRLDELRELVSAFGLRLARGREPQPQDFNRILRRSRGQPFAPAIEEAVLRAQAQAVYSPVNIGHFGLALGRYAHFTSPIRRYADLVVHRALISALALGEGGLSAGAEAGFAAVAGHVSMTERRAAAAERETLDRVTAAALVGRTGDVFAARVAGATRAGLFVALDRIGAQGFVPASMIDDGPVRQRPRHRSRPSGPRAALRGGWRLGDPIEVRLLEANPVTGGLLFAPAR